MAKKEKEVSSISSSCHFINFIAKKKGREVGACRQQQQQYQAYKNKISAKEKPRRTKVEPGY